MSQAPQLIDLLHLGRERVVGCYRVEGVLVDPGPASCLDALLAGLGDATPRALALTHIHLDHAGAAGSLVARWPHLEVWVHERGAAHLADPARLLASARRLYGEDMDRLWGEVRPVPESNLRVLGHHGRVGPFEYAHTPGHASRHVAYRHRATGDVYAGDVAGVRVGEAGPVLAPTPPPDIDPQAWRESLATLRHWRPRRLAVTHFGVHEDVETQLLGVERSLDELAELAGSHQLEAFVAVVRERMAARTDAATAAVYEQAAPPDQLWQGLRRHLQGRPHALGGG